GDRDARARAARARLAGDADHAALRLEDEIERRALAVGTVLPESRYGAVDDALVALARSLVVEAQAFQGVHAEVLDDDVALLDQLEEQLLPFGLLQIDDDAALVAVQADEIGGLAVLERDAPHAREIARAGRLELDHLRAEVGEHRRAERAREGVGEVQDF